MPVLHGEASSFESRIGREGAVAGDYALARAGAGAREFFFDADEFQRVDFIDVDQARRARQAHRHHRHEALSAGEELRLVAVLPQHRKNHYIAAALMRAAVRDTLERGYTHYVTDIFEGEKHSPYLFHTRVMGFEPVATHDVGELNCPHRRVTMVLDLPAAYRRLKRTGGWLFRYLTADWSESLHRRLAGEVALPPERFVPDFSEAVLA